MANDGFIKLYRKMLEWGWYDDGPTKDVFIHLLLIASYEDKFYRGIPLQRGQVVVTATEIAEKLGLSRQQVRTALNKLISTNEVTKEQTRKFSVFTIKNYEDYQCSNHDSNHRATTEQPQSNHRATTPLYTKKLRNKEVKNIPPLPPKGFDEFWSAYPKKTGKAKCREWWEQNTPDDTTLAAMIASVEYLKASEQWQKEDGRYIPMPATWLNQRRWEDEDAQPPKPRKRKKPIYDREYSFEERLEGMKPVVVGWEDEP